MKTIKNLIVTANYTVELRDIEVHDNVFEQLENNHEIYNIDDNINKEDALNWNFEIDEIEEY